jgi:autotransporter-associated beta strand protein
VTGSRILDIAKNGAGTQQFTGLTSHTGNTVVNAGTLEYAGAAASGSAHAVNGGTLALSGNGLDYSAPSITVNGSGSFLQTGSGSWATDLFHVNGSGSGTLQVDTLAESAGGSPAYLRYTVDAGGVRSIELSSSNPFAQYSSNITTGRNLWATDWVLDLTAVNGLGVEDFPELTLFTSTGGYNLATLAGNISIRARDVNGIITTFNNVGNGAEIYIQSDSNLATYYVNFSSTSLDLSFTGARAIPEPGTLSLIGLALLVLRRQFRKRCLAA